MASRKHKTVGFLVTGAAGYVGGAVCRRLLETTRRDLAVVDVRPVAEGPGRKRCRRIQADLADPAAFAALPRRVETVIHLAAVIDAPDPVELFRANVLGTARLLDYARGAGARRVVFVSTGGVYGYRAGRLRESHAARPHNDYAMSKYAAERLVEAHAGEFDTVILRLFFPYGPGQRGRFIPNLVRRIARGEPVDVHDGDRPRLNPVHVDDVIRAVMAATRIRGRHTLNIGGRQTVTVRRLAELIARRLGVEPRFRRAGGEPVTGDMAGSIRLARQVLGWQPEITLGRGLAAVVEAYRAMSP